MKDIKDFITEKYISWTDAIKGCRVIKIGKRQMAIVPLKGKFPKSFRPEKRYEILKRCGFSNIQLTDQYINGKNWEYFTATIPINRDDYKDDEIQNLSDVLK